MTLDRTANYHVEVSGPDGFTNSAPALVTVLPGTHEVVYQEDFEIPAGPEWSLSSGSVTPRGQRRFYGHWGNQTVRLSLSQIPPHTHLALQFDLYLIRTVEGANPPGQDLFRVSTGDGTLDYTTTFTMNFGDGGQNYPDAVGGEVFPGRGGAVERSTLGYVGDKVVGNDHSGVWRLNLNFRHQAETLELDFAGSGWQGGADESWGLDNVLLSRASLFDFQAPVLVSVAQDQVVHRQYTPAVFTASAIAATPMEYQWLHDGVAIPGATNHWWVISRPLEADAGSYQIRVSNEYGSVIRPGARLVVVTDSPQSRPANEGDEFQLTAAATFGAGYQWFKDGQTLPGETNAVWRKAPLSLDDAGQYSVRISSRGCTLEPLLKQDDLLPMVTVSRRGLPGEVLWSYVSQPPSQDFHLGDVLRPVTITESSILVQPFGRGLEVLSKTGALQQQAKFSGSANYGVALADGQGNVFVTALEKPHATTLRCLGADGTERWGLDLSGSDVAGPAQGVDGTLYLATAQSDGTTNDSRMHAVAANGRLLWSLAGDNFQSQPSIGADGTIYATTAASSGSVSARLFAVRADGVVLWTVPEGEGSFGSPAIGVDGTVYFAIPSGVVTAVSPQGQQVWRYQATSGNWWSGPVLDERGNLYFGAGDAAHSLSRSGKLRWVAKVSGYAYQPLAVTSDGTVYGSSYGRLFALTTDGTVLWEHALPRCGAFDHHGSIPTVDDDGTLYVNTRSLGGEGGVIAFRGTGGNNNGAWSQYGGSARHSARALLRQVPQNGNVSLGALLEWRAETQDPGATFQWSKDGIEIPDATNALFRLGPVRFADAGDYQVRLTSSGRSVLGPVNAVRVDGRFEKITAGPLIGDGTYVGANWSDFDGDGRVDVFLANPSRSPFLFKNLGEGQFEELRPSGILDAPRWESDKGLWADWNNDGKPELTMLDFGWEGRIFAVAEGGTNFVQLNSPELGGLKGGWMAAAAADYDLDGNLDLFLVQLTWPFENPGPESPTNNVLLRGRGDGTFERVLNAAPVLTGVGAYGASWCDYDNDGDPDLFVAHHAPFPWGGSRRNFLFRNEGGGEFVSVTDVGLAVINSDGSNDSPVWGDYDNDGDFDLLVTRSSGLPHQLFRSTSARFLSRQEWMPPQSTSTDYSTGNWGDLDNDGFLDAVVVANKGVPALVMRNLGDVISANRFTSVSWGSLTSDYGNAYSVNLVDYDNDGWLDVFVANHGGGNSLYRSTGGSNAWLKLRTTGRFSNRDGVGAQVRLWTRFLGMDRQLLRQISAGDGGGNQSGWEAHFGLADATNVNLVRIDWPSGQIQELADVMPRQILSVAESSLFLAREATAERGMDVELTPSGDAPEGATYQWFHEGQAIPTGTNRTLIIDEALATHAGSYRLAMTNGREAVTTGAMMLSVTGAVPFVRRALPEMFWPGVPIAVRLTSQPRTNSAAHAIEDQPPAGWVVTSVTDGGGWDASAGRVTFGPFLDTLPRELLYTVVPAWLGTNAVRFQGTGATETAVTPIAGDRDLVLGPHHPADINPKDSRIAIFEVTSYATAWKRGEAWTAPPVPIPIDYVTRAAYLWRTAEVYHFNVEVTQAPLWWGPGLVPGVPSTNGNSLAERSVKTGLQPPGSAEISVVASPATGVSVYALEEQVPQGWSVSDITEGGVLDLVAGRLRWGPFFESTPKAVRYSLHPTGPSEQERGLSGVASFDGVGTPMSGAIEIPVYPPAPRLGTVTLDFATGWVECAVDLPDGTAVDVWVSSNLLAWQWLVESIAQAGQIRFNDSEILAEQVRFYRLIIP